MRRVPLLFAAVLLSVAVAPAPSRAAAEVADPAVLAAETRIRLEIEACAARIQRVVAEGVNSVMSTRPNSSFRLRNAVRTATNLIRVASREEIARVNDIVSATIAELIDGGAPVIEASRLSDRFDTEAADQINALAVQGTRDVASLIRFGRRIPSVRGTAVDRYELSVSIPENGRAPVILGQVTLGESQLIRGQISTRAAARFFLAPLDGPTPMLTDLPAAPAIRAVRWANRGGTLRITTADSRSQTYFAVDQDTFSIKGVDLLPAGLRVELERLLEDSTDLTSNINGADGFFQGVTYTFRRIADESRP